MYSNKTLQDLRSDAVLSNIQLEFSFRYAALLTLIIFANAAHFRSALLSTSKLSTAKVTSVGPTSRTANANLIADKKMSNL